MIQVKASPHAVVLRQVGLVLAAIVMSATAPGADRLVCGAEPRPRAARSVHLGYEAQDAAVFCIEMTVLESTPGRFFMADGWDTGYFGLQELTAGRKVIIFSVWDPTRGDDPAAVAEDEQVECLHSAREMRIKRFVEAGDFLLATGGDVRQSRPPGSTISLPPGSTISLPPTDAAHPDVPFAVGRPD